MVDIYVRKCFYWKKIPLFRYTSVNCVSWGRMSRNVVLTFPPPPPTPINSAALKNKMQKKYTFIAWQKRSMKTSSLTLILLTWRIWWVDNNASRWQMGFSWAFKGLIRCKLRDLYSSNAMAQLVEALRYKPEGRGFDFRWCHWNFLLT